MRFFTTNRVSLMEIFGVSVALLLMGSPAYAVPIMLYAIVETMWALLVSAIRKVRKSR